MMWPSTAHVRPALSVTIGAITTVVFSPCATSRIRSCGGSQCADAEADVGVDLEMVIWLGVGFDVAEFTCDAHDEVRLLKASNVAAAANGLMPMEFGVDRLTVAGNSDPVCWHPCGCPTEMTTASTLGLVTPITVLVE